MFDGFFSGSRYAKRTDKQRLETRIKDSVLNLIIDRDQSFLKTSRQSNTSVIVNKRKGGIQEFTHNNRRFISFPDSMEKEFEDLSEWEAEEKMDNLLKLATTDTGCEYEENQTDNILIDSEDRYKSITGLDSGFEIERDATTNEITNNPFEYRTNKPKKNDKGMESSTDESESKIEAKGEENEREYSFEDTDQNIGSAVPKEAKENPFYGSGYDRKIMSSHREEKLKLLASQIIKSFKGRVSKQRTMIPSKRLVSKALVRDDVEKIYSNKKGDNGKHLKINLIIDMSGSMDGTPVNNAVEMIYIFNEIAAKGYLEGNVIWSESGSRCKSTFPMPREFIKEMKKTGGAEGLGENLKHYKEDLKKADTNICMTDGQLCNDPILKNIYTKEKIDIIGVYVNKNAKDLTEYTGSLDRWFTRSLVRHTTEELCEKLIQFSLRKKK